MGRYTVRVPFYDDTYLNKRLTAQQTNFEVLRGKISAIISDSEIDEYRNGNITMASRLSSAIQTVDGFSQQVSSLESEYNAATGEFSALKSKVSSFEQTVDGFTQQVSSWETIQQQNADDIDDINEALGNYVLTSELGSKIEQTAGSIDLKVFKNTTLAKKTDLNDYTKTANLNQYISSNKSQLGLDDSQIVAKVTGSSYWSTQATAIENLQDAQDEIDQLVSNIQATANAKSTVYYGSSTPVGTTANPLKTGDLWIDSAKNSIKRYTANNNKWTAVDNKDIASALTTAGTAKAIADGKIKTYTGNTQPTGTTADPLDVGDLWFDTGHDNKPYRWNGSSWISVQDATIAQAAAIAESAQTAAAKRIMTFYGSSTPTAQNTGDLWFNSVTKTNAKTGEQYKQNVVKRWNGSSWVEINDTGAEKALNAAGDAQATADGKIQTFSQPTAPANNTTNNLDIGDLWFDSDDNNKIYRWSGSAWLEVRDGAIASLQTSLTEVFNLADSKISTYYGSTTPSNPDAGDIWFNSVTKTNTKTEKSYKENVIKRYNGSAWVEIQDTGIETALNAAGTAQATADGKIETYFQQSAPTGTTANPLDDGDLWFDSDDNNKCYRYNATSAQWVEVRDSQILEAYNLAAKKIKTYYGTSIPANDPPSKGDMWIDTTKDANNKVAKVLKRYNGSTWEVMDSPYLMEAYDTACDAANLADHKMQVFYQNTAPKKTAANLLDEGDLWIDADDYNKMYRWDGSSWSSVEDGYIALAQQAADAANALAETKVTTYTSTTAPTKTSHPNLSTGDLWYNTTTAWDAQQGKTVKQNIVKRWDGLAWQDCSDSRLASAVAGIANLDDEKAQIFLQTTKPANNAANNLDKGDLWINTNDKNRIHIWDPAANSGQGDWVVADKVLDELVKWKSEAQIALTKDSIYQTITTWDGGGMELVNMINQTPEGTKIFGRHIQIEAGDSITSAITAGSIKPYYQNTAPTSPKIGDIWYNTSSSNYKIYTYCTVNGTAQWVETEQDKVPKDKVINSINQTPEGTKIDAKKIEITSGSEIQLSIDKATTIGENKSRTFRTSERPLQGTDSVTGKPKISTGDMWIDTTQGQGNKIYYWNGSYWQEDSIVSRINLSNENVTIDGGKIDISANDSFTITAGNANKALAQATTRSKIFRTNKAPEQSTDSNGFPNIRQGDMWVDTASGHNNQIYIWNGSLWQQDTVVSRINASTEGTKINADKIDIVASSSLRLMVTGKSKVFAQDTKPVREKDSATDTYNFNKGDIWYDTDDNYKMYVCTYVNGTTSTWTVASQDLVQKDKVVSAINADTSGVSISGNKIDLTVNSPLKNKLDDANTNAKVFRTPSQPQQSVTNGIRNVQVGDIWYDTTSGKNKMYFCSAANDSSCTWTPDAVISRINMDATGTYISGDKVKITANNIDASIINAIRLNAGSIEWNTTYSKMSRTGILTTTDNESAPSTVELTKNWLEFTRTGTSIGRIGTNVFRTNNSYKGLTFDLKRTGSYMAWCCDTSGDSDYEVKMIYTKSAQGKYLANTITMEVPLHVYDNVNLHNYSLKNCQIDSTSSISPTAINGGVTGWMNFGHRISAMNANGTVASWSQKQHHLYFDHGVVTQEKWE